MSTHEQKARDIVVAHYTGATDGASERLYDAIATALRATEAAAWKAGAEAMREAAARAACPVCEGSEYRAVSAIRSLPLPTRPSDE